MKLKHFALFFLFISIFSCNKDELKAPVPAYITIKDVKVEINDAKEGTTSDKITDVKVFIDDQSQGYFELPATIPVQKLGNVQVKVAAGIQFNGQSNLKDLYPFYDFYILDTNLVAESEIEIKPVVQYKTDLVFDYPWSGENFENQGINFERGPYSDTIIRRVSDSSLVFEGNGSGFIHLVEGQDFFEANTPTFFDIPRTGRKTIFLEFNYKSTHDFLISVYANDKTEQFSVVNIRAQNDWNKIYVDFSNVFSTLFTASNFNISLGFTKNTNEEAKMYLDNIKFVHY